MVVLQASAQTSTANLPPVVVTGLAEPSAGIAGFGDVPLSATPLQASIVSAEQVRDRGAQRLADLIGLDPALSDAYNAEGYWDYLTVRGYVLDNRFNYRRDGLPISAETSIPLENKSRIEILKGLSGLQAGTSAPGGLVNYVVKRPTDAPIRSASLEWRQAGSVTAAADISQRFGDAQAFGLRINAAAAHLDPRVRAANGNRSLLAVAGDWRAGPDTLIEAEFETSHRSQPSVPGFSVLGDRVPAPVDPRINLNNQPWSLPVVFDANTASLRLQQRLSPDWRFIAHYASQQLRTDDRIAFPFGFDCNETSSFTGVFYCDRYAPNGDFDIYDFRSENERRRLDALDLSMQGRLQTGVVAHAMTAGVLRSQVRNRFQRQAFNFAGTGNVDGSAVTPAAPALTGENTNRDERSTELYLRDALTLTDRWSGWAGLRHTQLERDSVRTDGTEPTAYRQSFTTPWLAASYRYAPGQMVYASWGRGIESEVAPNRTRYTNAGEALPALKSRQVELGLKGVGAASDWNLAWFDIRRPLFIDTGSCDVDASCTRLADGVARHRGIEAGGGVRSGSWELRGGVQWLHARVEASSDPASNGLTPTNVPTFTGRLQANYSVPTTPGLLLQGLLSREGPRYVLPDNSLSIPGRTQVDAGLRYETRQAERTVTWRLSIDNLFDKRAWKESPYQFGHAYLFPLQARALRLSVQLDL